MSDYITDRAAEVARAHSRQSELDDPQRRRQIDGQRALPVGNGKFLHRREVPHHRVVDDHIRAAEGICRKFHQPLHRAEIGEIRLTINRADAVPRRQRLSRRRNRRGLFEPVQHDIETGRCQAFRDRKAEPAAGAGTGN